jgi:hypothetical protein
MQTTRPTLVARVATLLFGGTPVAGLVRACGRPRPTALSWLNGRRRPPVSELRRLHALCGRLVIDATMAVRELDVLIMQREGEPKRLRGCCLIRADGRDRRGKWRR